MISSPVHEPISAPQTAPVRAAAADEAAIRNRQWIVSQIGAREHYTVPLGFEGLERLQRFYTDHWCRYGANLLRRLGGRAADIAGRFDAGIPAHKVRAFSGRLIPAALRDRKLRSLRDRYDNYIREGQEFSRLVVRSLAREGCDEATALFTFNTGALETLEFMGRRGVPTVVDQIDAGRAHEEIVQEELARWPGWQDSIERIPDAYHERIRAEWDLADVVLVNSQWSRSAVQRAGVPDSRIAVAPVAYSPTVRRAAKQSPIGRRLRVLWLGNVTLAKGIAYFLESARLLLGENVEFRVVGGLAISESAVASAPANVHFAGRLPRLETSSAYDWADLFVLPTISDGFAITQLEAMAHGLPVIATPNCGEVVQDGRNGRIVPVRDPQALAAAIHGYIDDPQSNAAASASALDRVHDFRVDRVAQSRLDAIATAFERLRTCRNLASAGQ